MKLYYVYILASTHRVLYIGVTGNLEKRLAWHRSGMNKSSFATRYATQRLVYLEEYTDVRQAIDREKQLKAWRRGKKLRLITQTNPNWTDLAPPGPPDPSLRSG
jgi:putative endonuclease